MLYFSTTVLIGGILNTDRIRLTNWLFTGVVEELKLGITVSQIQPVVRARIESGFPVQHLDSATLSTTAVSNFLGPGTPYKGANFPRTPPHSPQGSAYRRINTVRTFLMIRHNF